MKSLRNRLEGQKHSKMPCILWTKSKKSLAKTLKMRGILETLAIRKRKKIMTAINLEEGNH
jgi:hypothetical protein